MIVTISTKGQVVIPKSLREELGLTENTPLSMHVINGALVARPIDEEKIRRDLEILREIQRKAPKMSMKEINRVIKEYRAEQRTQGSSRH